MNELIGLTISHYKIIELIGKGGIGEVYKAEDTLLGRIVALKFLRPEKLADEEDRHRFFQEAQAAAILEHPNICAIYDICEFGDQYYIIMPFIEGETLEQKIKSKPISPKQAIEFITQLAEGLQEAHQKGIIHRDIKRYARRNLFLSNFHRKILCK